jgi:AcrR family transcriptional regulator
MAVTNDSSGRREQIRATAITLFAERGYRGTSMKDIAAVLNIRAPSLYNHLSSKQDLLREVTIGTMITLQRRLDEVLAETDDVVEQLRRGTEAHVLHHALHPKEVQLGNHDIASLEEPARTELLTRRRDYARAWQRIIERGNVCGRFDARSPKLAAFSILEMGIGVATWFNPERGMSAEEVAAHFGEIALRLVGADVPPT